MEGNIFLISSIFSPIFLGISVGIIHSTDVDHIVAISTFSRDYKKSFKSFWVGVSWGLGHSTPLFVLGLLILISKDSILALFDDFQNYLEGFVGIMLIFLGLQVFFKLLNGNFHIHSHNHNENSHSHFHGSHKHNLGNKDLGNKDSHHYEKHWLLPELIPFFRTKSYIIGVIHGLAGSGAIILTLIADSENIFSGLLILLSFSIGTMLSMSIVAVIFSIPFSIFSNQNKVKDFFILFAGSLSIIIGIIFFINIF